jgi:hypothetical protein
MKVLLSLAIFLLVPSCLGFVVPCRAPRTTTALSSSISMPPSNSKADTNHTTSMERKRWGVDKHHDEEYWFNAKIHSLGNTGFTGAIHAAMAPVATKMIDNVAYDGVNVRESVSGWWDS